MTGIQRKGDWAAAERLLRSLPVEMSRAADKVLKSEAQEFARKAKRAFDTSGASNGVRWAPVKWRDGKPLSDTGDLRDAIDVEKKGKLKYQIVYNGGKGRTRQQMAMIAAVHERGKVISQIITKKQHAAVMAKISKSGGGGGGGKGTFKPGATLVTRIPARSFMKSTQDAHFSGSKFSNRVATKIRAFAPSTNRFSKGRR